jgi:hypothetical protein
MNEMDEKIAEKDKEIKSIPKYLVNKIAQAKKEYEELIVKRRELIMKLAMSYQNKYIKYKNKYIKLKNDDRRKDL